MKQFFWRTIWVHYDKLVMNSAYCRVKLHLIKCVLQAIGVLLNLRIAENIIKFAH